MKATKMYVAIGPDGIVCGFGDTREEARLCAAEGDTPDLESLTFEEVSATTVEAVCLAAVQAIEGPRN